MRAEARETLASTEDAKLSLFRLLALACLGSVEECQHEDDVCVAYYVSLRDRSSAMQNSQLQWLL